jgi:hypothetical protein
VCTWDAKLQTVCPEADTDYECSMYADVDRMQAPQIRIDRSLRPGYSSFEYHDHPVQTHSHTKNQVSAEAGQRRVNVRKP